MDLVALVAGNDIADRGIDYRQHLLQHRTIRLTGRLRLVERAGEAYIRLGDSALAMGCHRDGNGAFSSVQ